MTLSLSVKEESPRYDEHTRTDSFQVPKGSNTVVITLPEVYHASSDYTPETAAERVALTLNGTPITANLVEITDSNNIVFTYTLNITDNSTIAGEVKHPNHKAFTVSVNGQGGTDPTGGSQTGGSQATTEPGVTHLAPDFLLDPNADTVIDRVTLAFYDKACTQYGITFHSYETLLNPVVQYVQGTGKTAADFASPFAVTAASETLKGFMAYNYNPTDFSFTASYEERNNGAGTMPEISDYTHKAALPELVYGTQYSYRVGGTNAKGQQVWSPIYTFKTRPQNPDSISFIWMSDSQYTPYQTGIDKRMRTVLNAALSLCPSPDMFLHGGDFSDAGNYLWTYAAQVTGNADFFTKYPLMSASGNHDTTGSDEIYRLINVDLKGTGRNGSQSTTTGTYYSYDYGDAHFVALNISKDAQIDNTQLEWLKNDLDAAQKADKKWKFVYFHRPLYTCAGEKTESKDSNLCSSLETVFNDYGVDVVIQAHVHMYSRTKPIDKNGNVATGWTTQTTGGYEYVVNPGAPIYTVTATAASNVEHIYRGADNTQPNYIAHYASGKANSFAIYRISGNTLSVDACYVDDNGANLAYYEKFGIIKNAS